MDHELVVIGVGNALRGDDAAGQAVIDELERTGCPARLVRSDGNPTALMAAWRGARWAVMVDAIGAGPPLGAILEWEAGDAPLPAVLSPSTHLVGPAEAIELGRALGSLPGRLTVVGIAGADYSLGATMSPKVRAAVATVATDLASRIGAMAHA